MKPLVVYYSLEGNTRCIAAAIAVATKADVLELKPVKDIKPSGFMRFVHGGKQVMTGEKPLLQDYTMNPASYDLVFVGAPVWAGTFAPALKTFLSEAPLQGKTVALFCCYAVAAGRTFSRMRNALTGNTVAGQIGFRDPVKHDRNDARRCAAEWARELLEGM